MAESLGWEVAGYTVYILKCSDGTFYAGCTSDMSRRLNQHNSGSASKYTRGRRPVSIVYLEDAGSRSSALKREASIKRLSRMDKVKLCDSFHSGARHSSR